MRVKKMAAIALATMMAMTTLAGCGGNASEKGTSAGGNTSEATSGLHKKTK